MCVCVLQLLWSVFQARFGRGVGAVPVVYLPAIGNFIAQLATMASASRYDTHARKHTHTHTRAHTYKLAP